MKLYFLYNPHILDFVEHVEEVITPVRNELMASEITEQAVRLLDVEHVPVPHISDMYEQNLVSAAKTGWIQEQARHPSYSTFHDPVRFQLVIYSVNGVRVAQCHTSHRGRMYYDALETIDDIESREDYTYLPQRDMTKVVYDLPETMNPMSKIYTTPEFYETMIAIQPTREKRLLEHIKNETNGYILKKKPEIVHNIANTGTTVDIMSVLRTVEEVISTVGEYTVLEYGDEPRLISIRDFMNAVKKTEWTVDSAKIEDLADMVIHELDL